MLENEIKDLNKRISYLEDIQQIDKKYGFPNNYKNEEQLKTNIALRDLYEKFNQLPKNALDIPSECVGLTIRPMVDEVEVEFSFKGEILQNLYDYACDSYSEWHIQICKFVEALFYNFNGVPTLKLDSNSRHSIENRCDWFYEEVLDFVEWLNGPIGKAVLKAVDTYYLGVGEACKEAEE